MPGHGLQFLLSHPQLVRSLHVVQPFESHHFALLVVNYRELRLRHRLENRPEEAPSLGRVGGIVLHHETLHLLPHSHRIKGMTHLCSLLVSAHVIMHPQDHPALRLDQPLARQWHFHERVSGIIEDVTLPRLPLQLQFHRPSRKDAQDQGSQDHESGISNSFHDSLVPAMSTGNKEKSCRSRRNAVKVTT